MDQPASVLVRSGIERRQMRGADLEPVALRADAYITEDHTPALVHRGGKPVRRLQRGERDRQVEGRHRAEL